MPHVKMVRLACIAGCLSESLMGESLLGARASHDAPPVLCQNSALLK